MSLPASLFLMNVLLLPSGWDTPTETDTDYDDLKNFDTAYQTNIAKGQVTPAAVMPFPMNISSDVPDGGTTDALNFTLPFPAIIHGVSAGCESAVGATGVVDLLRDTGSGAATVLNAPIDVKTDAGDLVAGVMEDSVMLAVDAGDILTLRGTSGAGGVMKGVQGIIWLQRA